MTSDIDVTESRRLSGLLFFNPSFQSDFGHAFAVCDQSHVALGDSVNTMTGVFVTERTDVDTFLSSTFPDTAEWGATFANATTGPFFGINEPVQKVPEFCKSSDFFSPLIPSFFLHGLSQSSSSLGNAIVL